MSLRVEIMRESVDRLHRKVWTFWYYDNLHALCLDGYTEGRRPTTRHKYAPERIWVRLNNDRRGYSTEVLISDEAILEFVPQDVKIEAAAKFAGALRVGLQEKLQEQPGPGIIR